MVSRLRERLRARKNLTVAEVGHLESHTRAVLAIGLVANDARTVRSQLDKLADEIDRLIPGTVAGRSVPVFPTPDAEFL